MSVAFLLIALLACGHIDTSTATICREALDLCFVLDGSASNCGSNSTCLNWGLILLSVKEMASSFVIGPNDTQVGLVTFGDAPKVEFYLNKHDSIGPLLADIADTEFPSGELNQPGLAFTMAIVFSSANGARSETRNISVLFTDGAPGISLDNAEAASTALQRAGVFVYVMCIEKLLGQGCTEAFAQRLSSPPKLRDETYFLTNYLTLDVAVVKLLNQLCGNGDYK